MSTKKNQLFKFQLAFNKINLLKTFKVGKLSVYFLKVNKFIIIRNFDNFFTRF